MRPIPFRDPTNFGVDCIDLGQALYLSPDFIQLLGLKRPTLKDFDRHAG
jgi:hypothetical protein